MRRKPKRGRKIKIDRRPKRYVSKQATQEEARKQCQATTGEWWDGCKKMIQATTPATMTAMLEAAEVKVPDGASKSWRRYRLAYLLQERRREEFGLETPPLIQRRIDKLDASHGKISGASIDVFTGRVPEEATMGTDKKTAKKKGKTIGARMVEILRLKTVPTNTAIVTMVKKDFPTSAFNNAHVSWYKGAFMKGNLPGQTKGEAINQPKIRETVAKAKTAKTAPKKSKGKTAKAKSKRTPKRKLVAVK